MSSKLIRPAGPESSGGGSSSSESTLEIGSTRGRAGWIDARPQIGVAVGLQGDLDVSLSRLDLRTHSVCRRCLDVPRSRYKRSPRTFHGA